MIVVVTGASGFVGSHVVEASLAAGHRTRALVRPGSDRSHLARHAVALVEGDLGDPASLVAAFTGAQVVLHLAGLVKARSARGFEAANAAGAGRVARAARSAGVGRLVLLSSLAARGPAGSPGPVSAYGRSKLAGEEAAREALGGAASPALAIVRPTAVYGPRDRSLLPAFRLASRGLRPVLRGAGRLSLVHAADLARGLTGLAAASRIDPEPLEVSDGALRAWDEVVAEVARAVGRPGPPLVVPRALLWLAALGAEAGGRLLGAPQVFTREKLVEMGGTWQADSRRFWELAGTAPRFDLAEGLRDTAGAYRAAGWL